MGEVAGALGGKKRAQRSTLVFAIGLKVRAFVRWFQETVRIIPDSRCQNHARIPPLGQCGRAPVLCSSLAVFRPSRVFSVRPPHAVVQRTKLHG
jgi:hypothetical protein